MGGTRPAPAVRDRQGGPGAEACIPALRPGQNSVVFLFFSNRLGCLGSLAVSAAVTVVLLLVLGVIRL